MAHPKDLSIRDFTYTLPEDRIAHFPLPDRDASKLLVYRDGTIQGDFYRNLAERIPVGSLMVFNDTKVIEARLVFHKPSGGRVEVFCLEPLEREPAGAMVQKGSAEWRCLVGGAGKWKGGVLERRFGRPAAAGTREQELFLRAEKLEALPDGFRIRLSWDPGALTFAEVLHRAGALPLPPYLDREAGESDRERYQTVYAREEGSVAAPTAGLHFTQGLMERLKAAGVDMDFVTLHVGAGTFLPVKTDRMEGHLMHAEWMEVSDSLVAALLEARGPIIAVGTTALRTLESCYWLGVKALMGGHEAANDLDAAEPLRLSQWEVYDDLPQDVPREAALRALRDRLLPGAPVGAGKLATQTQLLIAPGYRARVADVLLTNFHQPASTLLLLVAALLGEDWEKVYDYALSHDFRFLSYGDGSLLWIRHH